MVLAGPASPATVPIDALIRFSERLNVPVATTFLGKGVFPDDHPNALGTIGFMVRDYANFGFDRADVVVAVGYDLVEYSPERWNPTRDKRIVHIHRTVAEVDAHYSLEVGLQGSIGETLDAIAGSADMHAIAGRGASGSRLGARGAGARRGGRRVPAEAAAHGRGHPGGHGSRGHRPVRHRRGEDVDGPPLPDVPTRTRA